MENRNNAIIATVAAVLLCGCPGLASLCWGLLMSVVGIVPGSEIDVFGSSDPQAAVGTGVAALCIGLIFIAIPVAVGYFTLRRRPVITTGNDEPMPPAI